MHLRSGRSASVDVRVVLWVVCSALHSCRGSHFDDNTTSSRSGDARATEATGNSVEPLETGKTARMGSGLEVASSI